MLRFKQFLIEKNEDAQIDDSKLIKTGMDTSNPTPEDYDSPEYFKSLDDKFFRLKKGERVDFSPFDVMSLQFGKDKVKERDEYIQKLKDYYEKNPNVQNYVQTPTLSDEHLKERIPYIPSPVVKSGIAASHNPEGRYVAKYIGFTGSPESIENAIRSKQQPDDIKTSSYITINPITINTYDDDEIKNTLSHESWHRLTYPDHLKNTKEKDLKSPADIAQKYDIDPTFKTTISQMKDKYFERSDELRKENDSVLNYLWGLLDSPAEKLRKSKEREIKRENLLNYLTNNIARLEISDNMDDAKIALNPNFVRNNYYWNRGEVPAYMHELKMELMKKTNQPYRTSDQSDESIDSDADFLMNQKLDPDNRSFYPAQIKALQLLKTPEGKAIWRGVQKSAPKKDDRYV
jgi:hypothetical protein